MHKELCTSKVALYLHLDLKQTIKQSGERLLWGHSLGGMDRNGLIIGLAGTAKKCTESRQLDTDPWSHPPMAVSPPPDTDH